MIDLTMVIDHGINSSMSASDEIAISKFKATCLAVIENVRKTGKPVRITRFGKPVAEIVPPRPAEPPVRKLGYMEGELGDYDDLVAPVGAFTEDPTLQEWDDLHHTVKPKRRRLDR